MEKNKNWVDETVDIYDFIWSAGTQMCGFHVNEALVKDFREEWPMFEEMKKKIFEKYPTMELALADYYKEMVESVGE